MDAPLVNYSSDINKKGNLEIVSYDKENWFKSSKLTINYQGNNYTLKVSNVKKNKIPIGTAQLDFSQVSGSEFLGKNCILNVESINFDFQLINELDSLSVNKRMSEIFFNTFPKKAKIKDNKVNSFKFLGKEYGFEEVIGNGFYGYAATFKHGSQRIVLKQNKRESIYKEAVIHHKIFRRAVEYAKNNGISIDQLPPGIIPVWKATRELDGILMPYIRNSQGNLPKTLAGQYEFIAHLVFGLATIHALGYDHNDIKDDNIMIDSSGKPYIIDFGLSDDRYLGNKESGGEDTLNLFNYIITTVTGHTPLEFEQAFEDDDICEEEDIVYRAVFQKKEWKQAKIVLKNKGYDKKTISFFENFLKNENDNTDVKTEDLFNFAKGLLLGSKKLDQ